MAGLWEEVKARKIFKAATIYAAVAWGIIQIADVLLPVLGISEWVMSSLVLMAFSGLPFALILGWSLDIKNERRYKFESDEEGQPKLTLGSRIAELVVISSFSLSAAYLYYNSASEPVNATVAIQSSVAQLVQPNNQQKTIAVLPFVNFSDSTEDEYFADGLSEELLNVLARNKKLRVAARTSSFEYKKTNINIKKISEELGVQYILEGSVRRSGDLIRVTAQLIKADEDVHVFSRSWDRNLENVFKVQDEIAQSVLNELKVSLLGETEQVASEIGTHDIDAFSEYSKGMAFLRNRSKSDFENAIVHFSKAVEIDPDYADAMAMLAETYLLQVSYGLFDAEKAQALAEPLVAKSLEINPGLGAAHAVKGLMHWQKANKFEGPGAHDKVNQQLDIAKQHLSTAIEINPSHAEAYMWYGSILQNQGNFSDGVKLHEKAYEIDPRAAVVGYNRANDLVRLGDYKQAMKVFNTVVRNNPNYPSAYSIAGDVSFAVGQLDQAYSMYNRLAKLSEEESYWLVKSSRIYIPMGQFELAQQNVEQLKKQPKNKYMEKYDYLQAIIWIASKNFDPFYQWTESFPENTEHWNERVWRGFAMLKQQRWKLAIEDLSRGLELNRMHNANQVNESTIRTQLFLGVAYQRLGNLLKSKHYYDSAAQEIDKMLEQGFSSQTTRYQQAALAALKGENRQSLALLKQSLQEGYVDFWWTEVDPAFKEVRQEPEFAIIKDEFRMRIKLMQNSIESQFGKLAYGG